MCRFLALVTVTAATLALIASAAAAAPPTHSAARRRDFDRKREDADQHFSAMILVDLSTERVKVVGTVYNIQVWGAGNVLLDAGNVVFDDSTGSIVRVAGPHDQLSGNVAGLCSYLAAP